MKIIVLDGYTLNPGDNPWDDVAQLGTFTCYDRTPEALVVDRARDAEIVLNDADLADALGRGRPGGAALDVVSTEPIATDNPLLTAPNVTITPHIAWAALAARRRLMKITAENVAAFLAGRPINLVN